MKLLKIVVNALLSLSLVAGASSASAVEKVVYFHNDALGSPVAATNEQGQLLWTETYEPYGKRVVNPASDNKLWYTGKPEEAEFGLNYFGARWYDPLIGRFQGIDPVDFQEGNVQSLNRYAYANNNPYKYVDPDGETSVLVGVVALGLTVWAVSDMLDMPDVPFDSGAAFSVSPEAGVLAPGARFGELAAKRILEKSARNVTKSATQIAREGGKHAGQLNQFLKQTPEQLQKTIRSFDKQIAKHAGWIKDPTSKVKNFNGLRPEHQQNLIHHWQQDIARHQELKSIAQDVLNGL